MSNRLTFFREQMAAFEGTVNPQQAIESGYYVSEPRRSVSEIIASRIALRPTSTHLFLGGIGSGKTTQLLVTRDRINQEIEDVHACYVDVSLYTDISQLLPGVLVAIAGLKLAELLKDRDEGSIKNNINEIQKLAYGYSEKATLSTLTLEALQSKKYHEGILSTQSNETGKKLIRVVNQLNEATISNYGKIVILFDGLDRLDNISMFSEIVATDIKEISSINIGCILVGPLRVLYDNHRDVLAQAVDYFDYQSSCFDLENDSEAQIFFEKILKARASEGFIEESAIKSLIHYSGGVLRDLINLTQSSIEEAYLSNSMNLQDEHIQAALVSFGKGKMLGISNEELEILRTLLRKNTFIPRTEEDIRLLVTGRILEYRYPKRRYAVHPALRLLMQ